MHRIIHLTIVHNPYDVRIFHKECLTLKKHGYQVTLIIKNNDKVVPSEIETISINTYTNRLLRIATGWYKFLNISLKLSGDIYHFHDPELILTGLLLKFKKKKVIYDAHEDVPRQILYKHWIPNFIRKPLAYLFEKFENWAAKKFDYVVAATPTIRDRFLKIGAKSLDINNYPLLNEYDFSTAPIPDPHRICYAGGISEIRGAKVMLDALAISKDTILTLVGNFTPASLITELKKHFAWKNKIDYKGFLNRTDAVQIMSTSFAGLLLYHPEPNHIKAQPNKLFEYMAAGLPVIASNFPLWRTIIEEYNCGICVNPLDAKEIAEAITYLKNNPSIAREMGERGRKAILEKYNWENESKKLLLVYDNILECIN